MITEFADWVAGLPGPRMFAANPITFDGSWIDFYLRRLTRYGLQQGPHETERIFDGPGLCLRSYAAAITGLPVADAGPETLPAEWLGNVPHTHRAIDDARGYANLLGELFRLSGTTAN